MPVFKAPVDDTLFILNDVLGYERYMNLPGFADASPDIVEAVLQEGARIAEEVMLPLNQIGDQQGCTRHDDATVSTPIDGSDPRMTMFIWLSPPTLTIESPANIAGDYAAGPASFGADLDLTGVFGCGDVPMFSQLLSLICSELHRRLFRALLFLPFRPPILFPGSVAAAPCLLRSRSADGRFRQLRPFRRRLAGDGRDLPLLRSDLDAAGGDGIGGGGVRAALVPRVERRGREHVASARVPDLLRRRAALDAGEARYVQREQLEAIDLRERGREIGK